MDDDDEIDTRRDIINLVAERHILAGEHWKVQNVLDEVLDFAQDHLDEDDYDDLLSHALLHILYAQITYTTEPTDDEVKATVDMIEEALNRERDKKEGN